MSPAVGIDLGSSFSAVAYVDRAKGEARCIPGPFGDALCPSVVALDADGATIVGAPATRRSHGLPERGGQSLKRLLRTTSSSGERSQDVVRVRLGECALTLPEMCALILKELKMWAEVFLGERVGQAVITVPACSEEAHRRAVLEAAKLAGMEPLRLLKTPVAAALAYAFHNQGRQNVAVYELGGSSFEFSILKLLPGGDEEIYQVIASRQDVHLGGDDLDESLLALLREEILTGHGLDLANDPRVLAILCRALLRAKDELSSAERCRVEMLLPNRNVYARELLRTELEALAKPALDRTLDLTQMTMADAGFGPDDIDEVALIGSQTRMPIVRRMLMQFFRRQPRLGIDPEEAAALGAAVRANLLEKTEQQSGFETRAGSSGESRQFPA